MRKDRHPWAQPVRTIWFIAAMIPVLVLVAVLSLLSLVLMTPLMVYAAIRGKHLKDPWSSRKKL